QLPRRIDDPHGAVGAVLSGRHEDALAGTGRERNRERQLRVVPDPSPGQRGSEIPIAREIAVAVVLQPGRCGSDQTGSSPESQVPRIPAGAGGGARGPLEREEPRMAHERRRPGREETVPILRADFVYRRQNAYIERTHRDSP